MKQSSLPGFGPDESVVSAKPSRAPAASAARATAVAAKPKVAAELERAKPEKSPQAFRTISEVAEILDTPAHVLRFWESKFSQVKPMKRGGGRRYYRPEDVNLLRGVRELLYEEGMTIKGVQKVLRERGLKHVARAEGDAQAEERGGEEVSETIARLEALRDRLKA